MVKKITNIIILLLITVSSRAQDIVNGSFTQFGTPGCVPNSGTCATFSSSCVLNWRRTHGTPQVLQEGSGASTNYYMYMWSQTDCCSKWGEGVAGGYNFEKNRPYKVIVTIRSGASTNAYTNRLKLFAANGIAEYTGSCGSGGSGLPGISSLQPIGESTFGIYASSWSDYSYTFTPTDNYSQIWIYPWAEYKSGYYPGQFNIDIDNVRIIPDVCSPTIYYNTGTIPSGSLEYGNIYAGSSAGTGGSGIVGVSPTANTSMIAANEIVLLPELNIQVSSGYSFSASIRSCEGTGTTSSGKNANFLSTSKDYADIAVDKANASILVYPNPITNWLAADIYLEKEEKISVRLLNSMGIIIRQIVPGRKSTGKQRIEVEVSSLPKGIYILQVISKSGMTTKKVEKI